MFRLKMTKLLVAGLALVAVGCARPAPAPEAGKQPAPQQPAPAKLSEAEGRQALAQHIESKGPGTSNPHRFQYSISPGTADGPGWKFEVREFQRYTGQPWSLVEVRNYAVSAVEGKPSISVAASVDRAQATATATDLVLERNATKSTVIKVTDLPSTFQPYGAPKGTEFGVGKDGWGALALSPDMKQIAFVTRGTHPLFGTISVDTGKVRGLDLWYGGGAGELAWSFDMKWLASTVALPSGGVGLYVWKMETGDRVTFKGLTLGPETKVTSPRWVGDQLKAEVNGKTWTFVPGTGEASASK